MNHPLPIGTKIRTLQGERDEGDNGINHAPPGSVGTVRSVNHYASPQRWTYGVYFPICNEDGSEKEGVFVFIDQGDSIDDPQKYEILDEN